jgi:glycosyltransferase involved in cell wall biosynthesis
MRQGLAALLKEHHWDAIVLDGLYAGWALGAIGAHYERASNRPCLIYVSHNHEETTRMSVARNYAGNFIFRTALRQDAWKVARLERRMADQADVVTAITQEDAALFLARQPRKKTIVLPPGYGDRRLASRRIDAATPRRALLVGSFEWLAKQMNLKEFLAIADPLFAAAGLRMQIVGNGEEAFFDSLRRDVVATDIAGPVADVHPYLDQARIAIVPERSGGGFKLKLLEYVFNRVPIAALGNSIAGVPLEPRESVLTFSSYQALAAGVVAAMDDLELLNQLQEQAFLACKDEFDWLQRGEALRAAMGAPLSGASKDMAKAAVSAPLVPVQP